MTEPKGEDRANVKLDIRSVSKLYRSVVAVDDVSLQISDGEFLTLLGPSGSGKTTLLSMVAGLTTPDTGEIWIDGALATFSPPHKRDIGMVFQNYALFPHLSVFENIAFPLRMRRLPEARIGEEVRRVLGIIELPDVGERLPRQLSGGQQQRVALARCIVYQPSITIMDEPLGALDKGLRDAMQVEIKRLHRQLGITILYVTHDQDEALALSDRICLMRDGRAEQVSTPHELYFEPRSVFAARFIGDSNLLHGEVTHAAGDEIRVTHRDGQVVARKGKEDFAAGDRVVAMVRPEKMTMSAGGRAAGPCENRMKARVESVLFSGGAENLVLRSASGETLHCRQPSSRNAAPAQGGAEVDLAWNADDVVILRADGSGGA
jgi:putative spermidine/putrescine transport system ATP-binding protein